MRDMATIGNPSRAARWPDEMRMVGRVRATGSLSHAGAIVAEMLAPPSPVPEVQGHVAVQTRHVSGIAAAVKKEARLKGIT